MYFVDFYNDGIYSSISGRAVLTDDEFDYFMSVLEATGRKITNEEDFNFKLNENQSLEFTNQEDFAECFHSRFISEVEAVVLRKFIFADKTEYGDTYWIDGNFPYDQMKEFIGVD